MEENQYILTLTDAQAKLHRDFYKGRIEMLFNESPDVREYEEYKKLLSSIDALLRGERKTQLRAALNGHSEEHSEVQAKHKETEAEQGSYDKSWPLSKKAEFVLQGSDRLLNTREMISIILEYEPNYYKERGLDFDRFQKNLGSTLKQKIDVNKTFFRQRLEGKAAEYVYGLIDQKGKYEELKRTSSIFQ